MNNRRRHSGVKDKPVEIEAEQDRETMKEHEDQVVVSSDDSFPASDPPSFNPGVTGGGAADVKRKK